MVDCEIPIFSAASVCLNSPPSTSLMASSSSSSIVVVCNSLVGTPAGLKNVESGWCPIHLPLCGLPIFSPPKRTFPLSFYEYIRKTKPVKGEYKKKGGFILRGK
jgi:hypothetical protein